MGAVAALRTTLDKTGKKIAISADEWGLGPPWRVKTFGTAHGMYAAGFLGAVTRGARANNLQFSNYFEPVNEGAIQVLPFNSSLTPVGEVMRLYSHHATGDLLELPTDANDPEGDLDATATLSSDGGTLIVTVASLSAVGWATTELSLGLVGFAASSGTTVTLEAQGFSETSMFDAKTESAKVAHGKVAVSVPPFSVVQLTLSK